MNDKLLNYFDSCWSKNLDWENFDCLRFVVGAIEAQGVDNLPKIPKYKTPKQALSALKRKGCSSLSELLNKYLREIPFHEAVTEDIALIPDEKEFGGSCGIVSTDRIIVITERGLGSVKRKEAKQFFSYR